MLEALPGSLSKGPRDMAIVALCDCSSVDLQGTVGEGHPLVSDTLFILFPFTRPSRAA